MKKVFETKHDLKRCENIRRQNKYDYEHVKALEVQVGAMLEKEHLFPLTSYMFYQQANTAILEFCAAEAAFDRQCFLATKSGQFSGLADAWDTNRDNKVDKAEFEAAWKAVHFLGNGGGPLHYFTRNRYLLCRLFKQEALTLVTKRGLER